jgi:UDP-N-acetylglucosamine 2-epimerase (non-hydrolysing)
MHLSMNSERLRNKMKIMTVLGTRPEIIRLSLIIPLLDLHAEHTLVHTGQNYDPRLSEIFFAELGLRAPDIHLTLTGDHFGAQVGSLLAQIEPIFRQHRPDRLLILGDTNSGLVAVIARRLGIPVYHMEAGNRCFDDRVPEEVNRRVIDHSSSVLLPYTHNSKENLLAEGIPANRIYVTGNPIAEVIEHFRPRIEESTVLAELSLAPQQYFLLTLHRAENVDEEQRLRAILAGLENLRAEYGYPIVCSLHPRTRSKIEQFGVSTEGIMFSQPFGFFDFVRLEQAAFCVLSDSGTVQEECAIFGVPNVTLRDVTERPETLEVGSNALAGAESARLQTLVRLVTSRAGRWLAPPEYLRTNVAETVARILLSYRLPDAAERAWQEQR